MSNVVKEVKQKYELLIPAEIKQSITVKNYENLKIFNAYMVPT
jgi:flagellar assembly factor FliW